MIDPSGLRKGKWSVEEDVKLIDYIQRYGIWNWNEMPKSAGLLRSGNSCRHRWMNYLSPDKKHGNFRKEEEEEETVPENRKNGVTWSTNSSNLIDDDGYRWRKYGENLILNYEFPSNYFRCTYKDDQGCLATKQVERIQQDPPLYRTSYCGHHTCNIYSRISSTDSHNPMDIFDLLTPTGDPIVLTANENSRFYREGSFNNSVISRIATANSRNYSGEQVQYPDPMASSYNNYREEEEEDSMMGPINNPDSEMGKDLSLCYLPSRPSISSHLAETVTSSEPTSQTSSPSQTSSASVDFNDVFLF